MAANILLGASGQGSGRLKAEPTGIRPRNPNRFIDLGGFVKYFDIELAFEFVSSAPQYSNFALVSKSTGETFWRSDMSGVDDLPEDYECDDDLVEIPHKNELDCGTALVWQFVRLELPDEYERVRGIFSRRGAYGRYKGFLEKKGLLDEWHEFENARTQQALREWCNDVGIVLDD